MENNSSLSLKTRRILIIFFAITALAPGVLMLMNGKNPTTDFVLISASILMLINGLIGKYLKSTTDVFKIANNRIQLDERLTYIRIKAQRDAYFSILILVFLILPMGYQFYKNDAFAYIALTLALILTLILNLPAMLIAWQEKEV